MCNNLRYWIEVDDFIYLITGGQRTRRGGTEDRENAIKFKSAVRGRKKIKWNKDEDEHTSRFLLCKFTIFTSLVVFLC